MKKKLKWILAISAMNLLLLNTTINAFERNSTTAETNNNAIETNNKPRSTSFTQSAKADCLSQLLLKRYSGYAFDASQPVTHEQLQAMVDAARLAPSSYNEQPWHFIICNRNTNPGAYQKVFSALVDENQKWAKNAPVLIISVAASKTAFNGEFNRWGQFDTGAATFSMVLQATSLGLMTHQMGGFDEKKLQQLLSIPNDYVPMSVMAVGYPTANDVQTERKRKAYTENFFAGSWGQEFK